MIRGFYTARAGLKAHQEHMNTIANNMANVDTVGFKPMRTSFTDLMYQNLNRQQVENEADIGHGVKINKNDVLMAASALENSGYRLDFAILEENGFFAAESPQGEISYTRAGNFNLSNDNGTYYLVTGQGDRVLTKEGEHIQVAFDEATNEMQFDPTVIGVYTFSNPYGLSLTGGNSFVPTEMSGEAEPLESPTLKNGYIERSGVEISLEMVNMIESQKAFTFASRMVMTADEIEQTVNSLR